MKGTRVASRYAKAFIDLATETGVLEQAYADLNYISSVCKSNPDFVVFLKSPVIKEAKKTEVLKKTFEGKLNKATENFIQLVTNKKREMFLAEIANEFINQYKTNKKILTAVVTTANGLDDVTRQQIIKLVKGEGTSEVILQEEVKKDLVGGFIIRVGDKQLDSSIARKLSNLKRSFAENPYIKEF